MINFDSTKGLFQFLVAPYRDCYYLNSLEQLSFNEVIYRLLKNQEYQRVLFFTLHKSKVKYTVQAFDRFSYYSYLEPDYFNELSISTETDNIYYENAANLDKLYEHAISKEKQRKLEGPKSAFNKESIRETDTKCIDITSEYGYFHSDVEVTDFTNHIARILLPALNDNRIKTAVLIPETFVIEAKRARRKSGSGSSDASLNLDAFKLLEQVREVESVLIFYTDINFKEFCGVDFLRRCFDENDTYEKNILSLCDKSIYHEVPNVAIDEIRNLLLRKKIIEKESSFRYLPFDKIEKLAIKIYEKKGAIGGDPPDGMNFLKNLNARLSRHKSQYSIALEKIATEIKGKPVKLLSDINSLEIERLGSCFRRYSDVETIELNEQILVEAVSSAVIGQPHVIDIIHQIVLHFGRPKVENPSCFLSLGPSGVGKTETLIQIIKELKKIDFDIGDLLYIKLSDYGNEGDINKLKGAAPGYTGYGVETPLDKLDEHEYNIVLFDEMEKAHSSIYPYFMQLLETGTHDSLAKRKTIDCKKTIFAFTSNIEINKKEYEKITDIYEQRRNLQEQIEKALINNYDVPYNVANPLVGRFYGYGNFYFYNSINDMDADSQFQIIELTLKKIFKEYDAHLFGIKPELLTMLFNKVIPVGEIGVRAILGDFNFMLKTQNRILPLSDEYIDKRLLLEGSPESLLLTITSSDTLKHDRSSAAQLVQDNKYSETVVDDAMNDLNTLIGLQNVKDELEACLADAQIFGYEEGPGHYLFKGSPGTGKTTVARLVGKILKSRGLLKKGHLVEINGTDVVGQHQGEAQAIIKQHCNEALGGVLFIDEAYALSDNVDRGNNVGGEQAITALLTFLENPETRKNCCVIFAGYGEKMEEFLKINDGITDRIDYHITFQNYSIEELVNILYSMAEKQNLQLSDEYISASRIAFQEAIDTQGDTFSNARFVRKLLRRSRKNLAMRLKKDNSQSNILDSQDIPLEYKKLESTISIDEAMAELNNLIGLQSVKEELFDCLNDASYFGIKEGIGHFLFQGSPGTGKTTVARLIGRILKSYGILRSGHLVEVNANQLTGQYLGQGEEITAEKCQKALDGVLFVDEAYLLSSGSDKGHNPYGEQVIGRLLTFLENPETKSRCCVIFAGYENKMKDFLKINDGIKRRIDHIITFSNYSPDELIEILHSMVQKYELSIDEEYISITRSIFVREIAAQGEQFGNAGFVENYLKASRRMLSRRLRNVGVQSAKGFTLTKEDIPSKYHKTPQIKENELFTPLSYDKLSSIYCNKESIPYDSMNVENFYKANEEAILFIETNKGTGTAFLVSPDGYAITCNHVVDGVSEIKARLRLSYGDSWPICRIVKSTKEHDIALLKLDGGVFPFLKLADSKRPIERGERYTLLGYPFGMKGTYRNFEGTIADNGDKNRYMLDGNAMRGNSGSPIISHRDGTVIGILVGSITSEGEEINYIRPVKYIWSEFTTNKITNEEN